jgi:hypothetical protein
MPVMKEPRLSREIGRMAWFLTEVLVPIDLFTGLLFFFLRNPIMGVWIWCGLLTIGQIVYAGWQN